MSQPAASIVVNRFPRVAHANPVEISDLSTKKPG